MSRISILPLVFSIIVEVLASAVSPKEVRTVVQIGKEEVKLCSFADDMIVYVKNLIESTQKTTRINKFSKNEGYNIIHYTKVSCIPMYLDQS